MTIVTLDPGAGGFRDLTPGHRVVGRDDLGDLLAVDAAGVVFVFPHDTGGGPSRAFASMAALEAHVAFQAMFEVPAEASLEDLRARRSAVEAFRKAHRGSPYAREAAAAALEDLREAIADRRFWSSRRGRALAERQQLGARCEEVLRAAGAPGQWLVRAHAEREDALMVVGPFAEPWSEARVRELLAPTIGALELVCRPDPKAPGDSGTS